MAPKYFTVELLIQLVTYLMGHHLYPQSTVYLRDILSARTIQDL